MHDDHTKRTHPKHKQHEAKINFISERERETKEKRGSERGLLNRINLFHLNRDMYTFLPLPFHFEHEINPFAIIQH